MKQATGCKIAVHEAETKEVETLGPWTRVPELGLKFKPAKVDMSLRDGQHVQAGNVDLDHTHTGPFTGRNLYPFQRGRQGQSLHR